MNYTRIYEEVLDFMKTRQGIVNNPKLYKNAVRELTGMFCGIAYENDVPEEDVINFLFNAKHHRLKNLVNTGETANVSDMIQDCIVENPMYHLTEFALMHYRPGKVQAGPGEFFLCFYDEHSEFGVDNHCGYDIQAGKKKIELKKLGSNFTTPEIFDNYADSGKVDCLFVVKPVSEAKKPKKRSVYRCTPIAQWRDAFIHVGQSDGLLNLRYK